VNAKICPRCQTPNQPTAGACYNCGFQLAAPPGYPAGQPQQGYPGSYPGQQQPGSYPGQQPGQYPQQGYPQQPASHPGQQPASHPGQQSQPGGGVPKRTMAMSSEDAMKALSAAGMQQSPVASQGGAVRAPTGNEVTVGRDPANAIVFENPVVSARHARISRYPQGGLLVEDLGSTNGTYLRGERIQQRVVTLQDDVYLGSAPLRMSDPRVAMLIIQVQRPPAKGQPFTVGSDAGCDIVIHDPHVAPRHCQMMELPNGAYQVQDMGSQGGTAIDNASYRIQQANAGPSSTLLLGGFAVPVQLLGRMVETAKGEGSVMQMAQAAVNNLNLDKPVVTIGRAPGNDLVLPHPSVSGRHAQISKQPDGKFQVRDLGSTNGTYLNGVRISTAVAGPGDRVTIGAITLLLSDKGIAGAQRAKVRLDLIRISLTVKQRGTGKDMKLLDNVNLSIFPGELIGMLGPSGAGKTTLLMSVLGLVKPTEGGVLLNGKPLFQQYESFRTNVGFCPQDDIVHAELTVKEALRYACKLRLPAGTSAKHTEETIDATLKEVGLWEQRDSRIGSAEAKVLSGGQRRRVNLAAELVTDPSLLILDEPTSGLSWTDAADVISTLRRLADNGRTIVVTIHQPDYQEYEKFDSVCILGRGGKLLFFGPPSPDSYDFFGAAPNKPREMFDHLEQLPPDQWREKFQQTETYRRFVVERAGNAQAESGGAPPKPRSRSSLRQFPVLLGRSMKLTLRNPVALMLLLIQAPLLAVLIGLTTTGATEFLVPSFGCSTREEAVDQCAGVDDRTSCDPSRRMAVAQYGDPPNATERVKDPRTALLAMLMALFLPMIIASSNVLVGERTVYERERLAGLNILPYVIARLWVLWLLGAVVVIIHVPITVLWCGLEGNMLWYLIVGFLTTSTASAMGMALSAAVTKPVSALWGINFLVIPQLLFAGSISRLQEATWGLSWFTATRYGLESLTIVDVQARNDDGVLSECQVERYLENLPGFMNDGIVFDHPIVFAIMGMGTITFFAFVLTATLLKLKDK
jgi:ABC-type multidrug transport system ATPase subunit/pSer/pThr/pTyr-binding forkhead associated (FHA) protein